MFGLPYLDAGTFSRPLNLTQQKCFLLLIMCYPLKSDFSVGNLLIVKKKTISGQPTDYKIGICFIYICLELRSTVQDWLEQKEWYMLLLVRLKTNFFLVQ